MTISASAYHPCNCLHIFMYVITQKSSFYAVVKSDKADKSESIHSNIFWLFLTEMKWFHWTWVIACISSLFLLTCNALLHEFSNLENSWRRLCSSVFVWSIFSNIFRPNCIFFCMIDWLSELCSVLYALVCYWQDLFKCNYFICPELVQPWTIKRMYIRV